MRSKVAGISEALDMIKNGDSIAISAVGGVGYPEYLVAKLEERFVETQKPAALTLISAGGHGHPGKHLHDCRFAHIGFLKRHVCTHTMVVAELRELIEQNKLEAYALPQGVLNQLYRCAAAKQPGLLTKIGMGTYVDPRQDGGKLNDITTEDVVSVIEIAGEEWLFYKTHPVTVALIRGTYADERGNVTIDHEPLKLEMLECALAAKASNGKVIVQVEKVVDNFSLRPKDVVVPGELVDAVVVAEQPEIFHMQTGVPGYNPFIAGQARRPASSAPQPKDYLTEDDILLRRAVFELYPGAVVNLGAGVGGGTGVVAEIEGIDLNFTLELGVFGGTPLPPPLFGTSVNPESFVSPPTMFDYYHGENLDITILGVAQIDKYGNVNVSRFEGHPNGHGGFIDISTCAKKVVFCTMFRAHGTKAEISNGKIKILNEGTAPKFVDTVEQITFNAAYALEAGHEVVYITERAVFAMGEDGPVLTEIAPGIDLERDILQQMTFKPIISKNLKEMDRRIFIPGRMGIFDRHE